MRLLLCKCYEMPPSARASKRSGGHGNEARQRQDRQALHAGLAVGIDARRARAGPVARRAPRARLARRPRAVRPSYVGAARRRLALRPGPGLARRASPGLLVAVLRVVVDG